MDDASHAARRGALTAPVRRALIGAVVALANPHSGRKTTLDGVLTAAVLGVPLRR